MEARKIVLSLGLGTGLMFCAGVALLVAAIVGVTALHFMPVAEPPKPKLFPRLPSLPPAPLPRGSADAAEAFGPVNRDALVEPKRAPTEPTELSLNEPQRDSVRLCDAAAIVASKLGGSLAVPLFAVLSDGGTVLAFPPKRESRVGDASDNNASDDTKTQSTCPTCPNYAPPRELRIVPPVPQMVPGPPSYPIVDSIPVAPAPAGSAGGTWFNGPRGWVWIPRGWTYEHDSGLVRSPNGVRQNPITPSTSIRPAPLPAARKPKLPEQPPLADDRSYRIRPAVPDFTATPRGERKTGGYACANCKRPTVGDQWATQWTAEGTPISYLCRECWEKLTPAERQAAYIEWTKRAAEQSGE